MEWLGLGVAGPEKLQQRRLAFLSARGSSAKSKQAEEAAQCTVNLLAKSPAVGSAGLEVVLDDNIQVGERTFSLMEWGGYTRL